MNWFWGAAAALAAMAAAGSANASDVKAPKKSKGREELDRLLQLAPLDHTQRQFFRFVAWGESRWKSGALNDTPSEAKAAARSYERHADYYSTCGYPRASWVYGSAGWFQILAPVGLWQIRKTEFACAWDPATYLFDPAKSLTVAIELARNLQGWAGFKANPTVGNLRRGWGWPAKMGSGVPGPDKRAKYAAQLRKSGVAKESFLDTPIARMPGDPASIYRVLAGAVA